LVGKGNKLVECLDREISGPLGEERHYGHFSWERKRDKFVGTSVVKGKNLWTLQFGKGIKSVDCSVRERKEFMDASVRERKNLWTL
jgi:hypothetical protein